MDEVFTLPAAAVASLAIHGLALLISANGSSPVRVSFKQPGYSVEVVSVIADSRSKPAAWSKANALSFDSPVSEAPAPQKGVAPESPSWPDTGAELELSSSAAFTGEAGAGGSLAEETAGPGAAAGETNAAVEGGQGAYGSARILQALARKIEDHRTYPMAARKRGIQGALTAAVSMDEQGAFLDARVLRSSGSDLLDRAGMDLLRKVFPVENDTGRRLTLEVRMVYRLEGNSASP